MTPLWFVVVATIALKIGHANANCQVLQIGLSAQHPLLLVDNEYTDVRRFKRVDNSGYINMVAGENITLACAGKYNYMTGTNTKPVEMATASCVSGYNFRIDGLTVDIRKVACFFESPVDLQFRAHSTCGLNTAVIEVGFSIPVYPNLFLKLYEVCWDPSTYSLISTQHVVISGYRPSKSGTWSAYLFREINPVDAYVVNTQTQSFTSQLDSESAKKYITSAHFLYYRAMVPLPDFVYDHQQLSIYFYFNTVPLWRNFPSTYWLSLESSIRTLTNTDGDLDVYTGALGIHELPNSAGEMKPIYLYVSNDKRYMAVPAYLVKAVTNSAHEQVVFVQIMHRGEIARSTVAQSVCAEDVCAQLRWLPWRNVAPAERPLITCCRTDDPLLLSRLPRALPMGRSPSAGLLVGQAEHYD